MQGDGTTGNTAAALSFPFMHTFYAAVSTLTPPIKDGIMRAVEQLLALLGTLPGDANPGVARQVAILIANPQLDEVEYSRCGGRWRVRAQPYGSTQRPSMHACMHAPALRCRLIDGACTRAP